MKSLTPRRANGWGLLIMKNKIEHNGKLYDKDASYLVDGYEGAFILHGQCGLSGDAIIFPVNVGCDGSTANVEVEPFDRLNTSQYTTGTITHAPKEIELVNGEWYLCELEDINGALCNGVLFRNKDSWFSNKGDSGPYGCEVETDVLPICRMKEDV